MSMSELVASELGVRPGQVEATAALLSGGATVPFIARYRKEATGSLDEVAILAIRDRLGQLAELEKRREAIVGSLQERELGSDELFGRIAAAGTMTELEDLYLPYRPKRRTRGQVAREKGLEPLAGLLMAQRGSVDVAAFVDPAGGVADREEALAGARDILAEQVSEEGELRAELRGLFARRALLSSAVVKKKRDEAAKFSDYFDWSEPLKRTPSHRLLALLRGSDLGLLTVHARPDETDAIALLGRRFLRGRGFCSKQVELALRDAYKRLLAPALEREALREAKARADAEAVSIFVTNLRELLMAAPLSDTRVLAIDPGFRTGCKLVVLDARGTLLENATIYPTQGRRRLDEATRTLRSLLERHSVEAIGIGNGTAGRETEAFVKGLGFDLPVLMVDEAGASIYSASEVARAEFPDQDVTVRGAISIGRRLQDPLAELVKIDPKSIGVGQYQHDVDQTALKAALDDTVMSCVNAVGVDANSASAALLGYVAGLGPQLARNVVAWRERNGAFSSRRDLLKVARLGRKAFEQAAGFLRVRGGGQPLDASGVHPERYELVGRMAADQGCAVSDLLRDPQRRGGIDLDRYLGDDIGRPTLLDIMEELARPGRDPRPVFEVFSFGEAHEIGDLAVGMVLPGIVTNVTAFGAFVDIGVHNDGLVHVSELADRFVKDPNEVVRVRQQVQVKVLNIDMDRGRIGLSLRQA